MVVTMSQLVAFHQGNASFSGRVLPLKGAFKINRIKKDTEKDFTFYQEKLREILDKHAKKDEDGNIKFSDDGEQILIKDGEVEECSKELADLETMEIEIDNYDLNIDELGDIECTPEELEVLMPFFS